MQASFIIVNYNTCELLLDCISSLRKFCSNSEIIVVDNASTDGSVQALEKRQDILLIKSDINLGFSKANNLGYSYAKNDFIIFLNPDTKVISSLDEELISAYKKHFADKDAIIAPMLLNADMTPQHSLNSFPIFNFKLYVKAAIKKIRKALKVNIIKADWLTGACIAMPKKTIEKYGAWNEKFFLYSEDLEIAYRYNLNKIYSYRIGNIKLIHYGNQSGKQLYTNKQSFFTKTDALRLFYNLYFSEKKFQNYLKKNLRISKKKELIKQYIDANYGSDI